jgi:hypothetical protein
VPGEHREAESGHLHGVANATVDDEAGDAADLRSDGEDLAPVPPVSTVDVGDEHPPCRRFEDRVLESEVVSTGALDGERGRGHAGTRPGGTDANVHGITARTVGSDRGLVQRRGGVSSAGVLRGAHAVSPASVQAR